jgi:hypothetical protein
MTSTMRGDVRPAARTRVIPDDARLRYSGLSLAYGVGSTVFGGSTPLLGTFLVQRTGNALLPAWYATAVSAVALVCALLASETAPSVLAGSLAGEDSSPSPP